MLNGLNELPTCCRSGRVDVTCMPLPRLRYLWILVVLMGLVLFMESGILRLDIQHSILSDADDTSSRGSEAPPAEVSADDNVDDTPEVATLTLDRSDWESDQIHDICAYPQCMEDSIPKRCMCSRTFWPPSLQRDQVPQMVMLSFDDHVGTDNYHYFQTLGLDLSSRQRPRNPNGCPITATFFVSDVSGYRDSFVETNYSLVESLYRAGHTIASHGVSHRWPYTWWQNASASELQEEFVRQRKRISRRSGIPETEIAGTRTPFLALGGDDHYVMAQKNGFEFDASVKSGPFHDGGAWPVKGGRDFPHCNNIKCPDFTKYPDLWIVPLNSLFSPRGKGGCSMADHCTSSIPKSKRDIFNFFSKNFFRHYDGNKAPINFCLHTEILKHNSAYLEALREFLLALSQWDDVYVVSAGQIIEWMKLPTPLGKEFLPWTRSCTPR